MCTLFMCCMPSISVFGSSNTSIKSEDLTTLSDISCEITKVYEAPREIMTDFTFCSPKTSKHEQ